MLKYLDVNMSILLIILFMYALIIVRNTDGIVFFLILLAVNLLLAYSTYQDVQTNKKYLSDAKMLRCGVGGITYKVSQKEGWHIELDSVSNNKIAIGLENCKLEKK